MTALCSSTIISLLVTIVPAFLLFLIIYISDHPFHRDNLLLLPNYHQNSHSATSLLATTGQDKAAAAPHKRGPHGLERIEDDLAKARAEIHRAVRLRKHNNEQLCTNFTPRGSIFRNSYAFHQSHIEMMKRFKVWTYREGERPLVHAGPLKDIYAIEGQFISEMESGLSPFMASDPEEAHAFFIPISVTHIVEYVYKYHHVTNYSRHPLQQLFRDYVTAIAHNYPYWNRSNGADHFFLSCHDWAPDVSSPNPKPFKNLIRVLCNANTSEGFQPDRDISMPEIFVPTETDLAPPDLGQLPNKRSILAFFAGGAHGDIRKSLLQHWKDKDNEIRVFEYLSNGQNYTKLMGQSKFCLCPSGFEVASARVVEAIYAGCVPVIISANYSLPFSDVFNWDQVSISISVKKIPEIKLILQGISNSKYLKMQKRVRRLQRHFKIQRPAKPFDVIHMLLHSVWLRRLNFRLRS